MIIGLHGLPGSGKNETARRLASMLHAGGEEFGTGPRVIEVSFAAQLKQSAAALLDCSVDDLERWKNEPWIRVAVGQQVEDAYFAPFSSLSVRDFLRRYGTEAHREVFDEDFWLDAALPLTRRGNAALPFTRQYRDALYVVTDVRFPNEAQRVRDLDGVMVRIVGPEQNGSAHPSDQSLPCDYEIDNTVRDDGFAALDYALAELFDRLGA